jgi:hypothetical protein
MFFQVNNSEVWDLRSPPPFAGRERAAYMMFFASAQPLFSKGEIDFIL